MWNHIQKFGQTLLFSTKLKNQKLGWAPLP